MNIGKLCLLLIGVTMLSQAVLADSLYSDTDLERLKSQWQSLGPTGTPVDLGKLPPFQAAAMKRSDLDGDGLISFEEYLAYDRDPGGSAHVPLADNVELVSDIPYANTDNPRQRLDLYLPKQASKSGPLPVIVYIHGGGWQMGSKIMARTQIMDLVNSGRFVAVSAGYRLGWEAPWPAQSNDLHAALRWIRANAEQHGLDSDRVCAMGASAGGHIAAHLGVHSGSVAADNNQSLDQSAEVQCVVNIFGPADLTTPLLNDESSPDVGAITVLLGGTSEQNPDLARLASPVYQVKPGAPPFLVIHGTEDPVVAYDESVRLVQALEEAGVTVYFQTVEGGGHGNFGAATDAVNQRVEAFLNRVLYNDSLIEVPTDTLSAKP